MKLFLFSLISLMLGVSIAFADGTMQVVLTWSNPDGTNQVQIEKAAVSTGPWNFLALASAGTTSYVDRTNTPGDRACYRFAYFDSVTLGPFTTPKCKTFSVTPTLKPASVTLR